LALASRWICSSCVPSAPATPPKRLLAIVSRVQLLSLFLVVADMVLKPTSDDPWELVVLAAILVVAAAAGAWTIRKPLGEAAASVESR
jgi:uncharacterized membrane protein YqjE